MTLAQYLRLLRTHWLVVALLTVSGSAGAATYAYLQTPQYTALSEVFVSTSAGGSDVSALSQASTFSQQRVKSYTALVTGPTVLQPVIDDLHLQLGPDDLAAQVSASSPLDTVLIQVSVTDPSPRRAADIANSIALHFPTVVRALETAPGKAPSPVTATVTRRASVPVAPVSPRIWLDVALGLLVGLGLGVGIAVLRDSLDRSVSTKAQAAEAAGSPVLGTVADDPAAARTPLIVHDPFSPRAEAFRQLRTNIRFLSVDHQLRSLVVTGSIPSEGKSTTAANLAIAMASSGEPVVLIDADLRRPTLADVFGLPGGIGLTTVLIGDADVSSALQPWRPDLPLQVLTAGPVPPNPSELIGSARMVEVVAALTAAGLTVVIDSPPLLPVTDAAILARVTDGALIVTRAGCTHVEQLAAAAESLRAAGATVLGVVLNRVPKRGGPGYGTYAGGYSSGYVPAVTVPAVTVPAPRTQPAQVLAPVAAPITVPVPVPVPVPILTPVTGPAPVPILTPVTAPETGGVRLTGVAGLLDLSTAEPGPADGDRGRRSTRSRRASFADDLQ